MSGRPGKVLAVQAEPEAQGVQPAPQHQEGIALKVRQTTPPLSTKDSKSFEISQNHL